METAKERVAGLLKGCGCKIGCQTHQCGCKRKRKNCSEGCNCTNCTNTNYEVRIQCEVEEASIEEILTGTTPEDIDEVMEWVFGGYKVEGDSESENESDTDY